MPAPIIAAIGTVIVQALRTWAGSIFGAALTSLGLYFFIGEPAMDFLLGEVQSRFNFVSGTVRETLIYLNVDDFLAMVITAATVRATWDASVKLKGKRGKAKPLPAGG